MKYLITGGLGFIGSNLVKKLQNIGDIYILDNENYGINNLLVEENLKYQYIKGDILDENLIKKLFENHNFDIVIHLASEISVYESTDLNKIKYYNDNNVNGTINLLKNSVENNVKHFIFASSCAVYGNTDKICTENTLLNPENPYAINKKHCEDYCNYFGKNYDMKITILRFSNVFGNNQLVNRPYSGCIINFVENIRNNKQCIIYGDGTQKRDFIHVDDIINGIIFMINNSITGTYNVSTGKFINVNDLLKNVYKSFNESFKKPVYKEMRNGDFKTLIVSNQKLLDLGFKFQHETILDGLNTFYKQEKVLEKQKKYENNIKMIDIFFNSIQNC